MKTNISHLMSTDMPLYRYISFEKVVWMKTKGFYVPIADSFEDLNEGAIGIVPDYLKKNIEDEILRVIEEIKSLPCAQPRAMATIFEEPATTSQYAPFRSHAAIEGILSHKIRDFYIHHTRSANSTVDEKKIRSCANALCILDDETKIRETILPLFEDLAKEDCRGALISCWNKTKAESNLLWKTYAENKGVRIKTTLEKLWNLVRRKDADIKMWGKGKNETFASSDFVAIFGEVEYLPEEDLKEKLCQKKLKSLDKRRLLEETVFFKSEVYRSEEEFRVLLYGEKWEAGKLTGRVSPQDGVTFPIPTNTSDFLEEIMLSPFLSDFEADSNEQILREFFPGVDVKRSSMKIKS